MPRRPWEKERRNALSNLELCNGRSLHVARGFPDRFRANGTAVSSRCTDPRGRAVRSPPAIPYVRTPSVSLWKVSPGTQSALSIITASLIALLVGA